MSHPMDVCMYVYVYMQAFIEKMELQLKSLIQKNGGMPALKENAILKQRLEALLRAVAGLWRAPVAGLRFSSDCLTVRSAGRSPRIGHGGRRAA